MGTSSEGVVAESVSGSNPSTLQCYRNNRNDDDSDGGKTLAGLPSVDSLNPQNNPKSGRYY